MLWPGACTFGQTWSLPEGSWGADVECALSVPVEPSLRGGQGPHHPESLPAVGPAPSVGLGLHAVREFQCRTRVHSAVCLHWGAHQEFAFNAVRPVRGRLGHSAHRRGQGSPAREGQQRAIWGDDGPDRCAGQGRCGRGLASVISLLAKAGLF